uniref:Uncharacterized protein n=1 Tax=Arundo donax TaxID=35708 RepID=A0A0A9FL99_ARUDO
MVCVHHQSSIFVTASVVKEFIVPCHYRIWKDEHFSILSCSTVICHVVFQIQISNETKTPA